MANQSWLDKAAHEFPDLYDLIRSVPKDVTVEYNQRREVAEAEAFAEIRAEGGTIVDVDGARMRLSKPWGSRPQSQRLPAA